MSNLIPASDAGITSLSPLSGGSSRFGSLPSRTARTLQRLGANTTVAVATTYAQAEIESARTYAISQVAGAAMQNVALLSQMEQSLAQAVPHASGRLAMIADMTAISLADSVAQAARRIGR